MAEKDIQNTEIENIDDSDTEADARVYEAGILVMPSLGEEGARAEFDVIRKEIMKKGGIVIAEEAPELLTLAYTMQRDIERKRHTATTAYFGWVKFEAAPEAAHALKAYIADRPQVLRSLLIKTTREAFVRQMPQVARRETHVTPPAPVPVEGVEPKAPASVAQIDAEIEKLLVE